MGSMLAWSLYLRRPAWQLLWLAILFASIGLKKLIDLPHARRIRAAAAQAHNHERSSSPVRNGAEHAIVHPPNQ
jgi:hypothetical protein